MQINAIFVKKIRLGTQVLRFQSNAVIEEQLTTVMKRLSKFVTQKDAVYALLTYSGAQTLKAVVIQGLLPHVTYFQLQVIQMI